VDSAAETSIVPLRGDGWNQFIDVPEVGIQRKQVDFDEVSTRYFETLRIPLLAGRDFSENDTTNSPLVAIVNQKFARTILRTNNIDHHRTADFAGFARAIAGKENITATMRDVASAPAILLIGNDPTERHPLLAWNIRSNVRLNQAKLFVVNSQPIKLQRQAAFRRDQRIVDRHVRGGNGLQQVQQTIRNRLTHRQRLDLLRDRWNKAVVRSHQRMQVIGRPQHVAMASFTRR